MAFTVMEGVSGGIGVKGWEKLVFNGKLKSGGVWRGNIFRMVWRLAVRCGPSSICMQSILHYLVRTERD